MDNYKYIYPNYLKSPFAWIIYSIMLIIFAGYEYSIKPMVCPGRSLKDHAQIVTLFNICSVSCRGQERSSAQTIGLSCNCGARPCRTTGMSCNDGTDPCKATGVLCNDSSDPCRTTGTSCNDSSDPCRAVGTSCNDSSDPCRAPGTSCNDSSDPCRAAGTSCNDSTDPCRATGTSCNGITDPCKVLLFRHFVTAFPGYRTRNKDPTCSISTVIHQLDRHRHSYAINVQP